MSLVAARSISFVGEGGFGCWKDAVRQAGAVNYHGELTDV